MIHTLITYQANEVFPDLKNRMRFPTVSRSNTSITSNDSSYSSDSNEFDRFNVDNVTFRKQNINKMEELSFDELFKQWIDFERGEDNKSAKIDEQLREVRCLKHGEYPKWSLTQGYKT